MFFNSMSIAPRVTWGYRLTVEKHKNRLAEKCNPVEYYISIALKQGDWIHISLTANC